METTGTPVTDECNVTRSPSEILDAIEIIPDWYGPASDMRIFVALYRAGAPKKQLGMQAVRCIEHPIFQKLSKKFKEPPKELFVQIVRPLLTETDKKA